ncbi:MAG: CaiB/BaiF CoA-transferase family protein [Candidatus Bathyarchaeia archaeon]
MVPPLKGIRILDLSRILTGPFCSMILADLGAEVIKVEMPRSGDDARLWGPPFIRGESAYFLCLNRNKKSITLNLKSEKGKAIIYKLVKECDVLLENFKPGVTKRLGVDYETISKINPRIIYCSITGFGQTGPYRDYPAYDIVIEGMGGLMGITSEPDRPPREVGIAIADIGAGMYAAIAILAALIAREKTGKGQWIDVSLLDSTVSLMTHMAANYFATGIVPKRDGSTHPNIAPYQCFKARDGKYLTVAVGNDRIWRNFCEALGLADLAENPKFSTNPKRVKNRDELIPTLEKIFLNKTRDEWIDILLKKGVPCGPVYAIDEVFRDPQVLHRKMLVEIEHPKAGTIKQIGIPMKFSETPGEIRTAPPLLGQHTDEILKNLLGYSEEEINQLRKEGVI